jgi:hypothetical protein
MKADRKIIVFRNLLNLAMAAVVTFALMSAIPPPGKSVGPIFLVFGGGGFMGFFVISRMAKKGDPDSISLGAKWLLGSLAAALLVGIIVDVWLRM